MHNAKPLRTKHWITGVVLLVAIVLIVHFAIITAAMGQFSIKNQVQTSAFTIRMVDLPVVLPAVQKPSEPVVPAKTVKTQMAPKTAPKSAAETAPKSDPVVLPLPAEKTVAVVAESLSPPPPFETIAQSTEHAQATPAPTAAAELPPPAFTALAPGQHTYKALFTTKGNTNQGQAVIQWQQDGEKYALGLSASVLMLDALTWKSTGLMSPQGLLPDRFSDKRFRKSEVAAHFDRIQNKIIFSANTPEALLQAGAQDRISAFWQLAGLLLADPARYPTGATISLQMVDATEAETWVFSVNEPETLNLESGSQLALRLTRNPRKEFDRKVELWFAPALGYLPVRMRQTQTNGDYFDFVWQNSLQNALQK
jgi:Protein of unknown function (DUF3108)